MVAVTLRQRPRWVSTRSPSVTCSMGLCPDAVRTIVPATKQGNPPTSSSWSGSSRRPASASFMTSWMSSQTCSPVWKRARNSRRRLGLASSAPTGSPRRPPSPTAPARRGSRRRRRTTRRRVERLGGHGGMSASYVIVVVRSSAGSALRRLATRGGQGTPSAQAAPVLRRSHPAHRFAGRARSHGLGRASSGPGSSARPRSPSA